MKSSKWSLICLFVLFLFFGSFACAVNEQEISNMENAMPKKSFAKPMQNRKMLVFNLCNGFEHSSIPYWDKAIEIMGKSSGAFEVEFSNNMNAFDADNLKRFDAVCLNNTTGLRFSDSQKKALMDFIKGGKGIVGIHAATDNFSDWQEAAEMMGGQFTGHPWGAGGNWAVKVDDPGHPLTKPFEPMGISFKVNDEIYRTEPPLYSRNKQRVLLSLDMSDEATAKTAEKPTDADTGISWIKTYGKGRLFYCSLGHNHHLTWTPAILQHYLAGIQFALGDLQADATPLPYEPANAYRAKLEQLISKASDYDWNKSREPLSELEDFIRSVSGSDEVLREIEKQFDKVFDSNASLALKQFICRQLSVIGSEASVKTLVSLLNNKDTSDMARYALERIPGEDVDRALREKLIDTTGEIRIGIINSIGVRRDKNAVEMLKDLAEDKDTLTACAAINSLGKIGNDKAAVILSGIKDRAGKELKKAVLDSYIICGYGFAERGDAETAGKIFTELYKEDDQLIRVAAFNGLVEVSPDGSADLIISAMRDGSPVIRSAAFTQIGNISDSKQLSEIAAQLKSLEPGGAVQLLTALAGCSEPDAVRKSVLDACENSQADVRVAALKALANVGNETTVELLAQKAADADSAEQQAARQSLYMMKGTSVVDKTIVDGISKAKPDVKVELIKAIAERRILTATDVLMKAAIDPSPAVRKESLKALSVTAGKNDMAELSELLAQTGDPDTRNEAARTLAAIGRNITNDNKAKDILPVFEKTDDVQTKIAFIEVLGKLSDDNSFVVLERAALGSNDDIKVAAIRALCEWSSDKPMDLLEKIAKESKDTRIRILALRGYVRMIGLDAYRPAAKTVQMYKEAMNAATQVSEKKMVLSSLGEMKSVEALDMAAEYLESVDLKNEAQLTVVKIAPSVSGAEPQKTKSILNKLLEKPGSDNVRQQAEKILENINRFEDFITAWQVSGPYTESNLSGPQLFDKVFAPEEQNKDVKWQIMPTGTNESRPWLLELDKFYGGDNRVAYLKSNIFSDKEQKVSLEFGSDDGIKVWLNGRQVLANNATRACEPGQEKIEVTLEKGKNTLLLKITQGGGQWAACARIVRDKDKTVEGIKIELGL